MATKVKATPFEPRVREFLAAPRYAVIATVNPDGSPQLTEIWYDLRGDELIVNIAAERVKVRNLARDPRVSLLVAGVKGEPTWNSITYVRVDGRAREIASGSAGVEDIYRLGIRYDGPEEAERTKRATWSKQQRVSYAIDARRVYVKGL
jgi:PPOX class probable F420-dependent enzyme